MLTAGAVGHLFPIVACLDIDTAPLAVLADAITHHMFALTVFRNRNLQCNQCLLKLIIDGGNQSAHHQKSAIALGCDAGG